MTNSPLEDGGFVVTWQSNLQDGSGNGIYAQRYDASGTAVGSEFQVNTYAASDQTLPVITGLSDGGFLAVWVSDGQDGSGLGIFAQRFDDAGARLGSEFQVNDYAISHQSEPAVTELSDGTVVVTWNLDGQDGSGAGVYAKSYTLADPGVVIEGTALGDTITGEATNGTINGGAGNDILTGGEGDDTYQLARGDGQDVINNIGEGASADKVSYAAGVKHDQLWFTQSGNDLVVSVLGTTDQVSVTDWYAGPVNHVAGIETADGFVLSDALVNNFVNAMAAMTPPPVGQTDLTVSEHTQLDPVLAANWQQQTP